MSGEIEILPGQEVSPAKVFESEAQYSGWRERFSADVTAQNDEWRKVRLASLRAAFNRGCGKWE